PLPCGELLVTISLINSIDRDHAPMRSHHSPVIAGLVPAIPINEAPHLRTRMAGTSRPRTLRNALRSNSIAVSIAWKRRFCAAEPTPASLPSLFEISQIRRRLVFFGRHQKAVGAQDVNLPAQRDQFRSFDTSGLAPGWMRI